MENLSTYLSELSVKAKALEDKASAFHQEAKEEQTAWLKAAKADAKAQKALLKEKIKSLKGDAQSFWENVNKSYNKAVRKGKIAFKGFKNGVKVNSAAHYAEVAEEDAAASILFALNAMATAEKAVIEALDARAKSDAIKDVL
ncbi:MAG: hypothetical protein AAGJ18_02305 [Bacteroidota bacterium]